MYLKIKRFTLASLWLLSISGSAYSQNNSKPALVKLPSTFSAKQKKYGTSHEN